MTKNNIRIAENITKLRKEKNETQMQLAEAVGVSNKTISKWETAESEPELSYIAAIAGHYKVSMDSLIRGDSFADSAYGSQNNLSYREAALKHFYDSKNISDYMIFPSPTSENLLIGCEISKDAEPCFVFVWTEEPLNRDLKEYIGKISETEEIPHIVIVYTDKSEEKDIDNYITAERHGEKVKKYFTEV